MGNLMIDNTLKNSTEYRVAYSMYVTLGGDPTTDFDSVEAIYDAIDILFGKGNNRVTVEALRMEIIENGDYNFDDEEVTGYKPVNIKVDVPQKYTDEQVENIRVEAENNGYNNGYGIGINDGYNTGYTEGFTQGETEGYNDGYAEGLDDGAEDQKALLEDITITENGVYEKEDGYKKVTVEVPIPEIPTFETESLTKTLKTNGTYNYTPTTDGFSDVNIIVDVPTGGGADKTKIYNGFQFTGGDIAQVDFSQYDWSGVYDTDSFFERCSHSTGDWSNFEENYNGKILNGDFMFNGCKLLVSIPQLDTSNVTSMSYMFQGCYGLTTIPQLDTSNVRNMSYMFNDCPNLTSIPQLDTSNVTNMRDMFNGCKLLVSIPQLDTSNVIDMRNMFYGCKLLVSIPQLDTSNVTDMYGMFSYCSGLTSIPELDTSKVTNMYGMFSYCSGLTSIPELNTSNVTDMSYMFSNCGNLTSIPELNCRKISNRNMDIVGANFTMSNLTDLGGFKDLGEVSGFYKPNYFLRSCPNLTKESVMNVINKLYDRKSAGYSVVALPFNTNSLALLSDEEKAIATNKGWTLATS